MLYDETKFEDLFDSKEQAVVCYLSLERRFLEVYQELRERKAADRPWPKG